MLYSCESEVPLFGEKAEVVQYITVPSNERLPVHMIVVRLQANSGEEVGELFLKFAKMMSERYGRYSGRFKDIALAKNVYVYTPSLRSKSVHSVNEEGTIDPSNVSESYYFADYQIEVHPKYERGKPELILIYRNADIASKLKNRLRHSSAGS